MHVFKSVNAFHIAEGLAGICNHEFVVASPHTCDILWNIVVVISNSKHLKSIHCLACTVHSNLDALCHVILTTCDNAMYFV